MPLHKSFTLNSGCTIERTDTAKNLGFWFDSNLSLDKQLSNVKQVAYMNLRNLGRIGSKLNHDLKVQLVHACIHSILDYCNCTYGALTNTQLQDLQKIQNAAVRFIFNLHGNQKRLAVTPFLKDLHFLPVRYRIMFKTAMMVFKCLNNIAPIYLIDLLTPKIVSRYSSKIFAD